MKLLNISAFSCIVLLLTTLFSGCQKEEDLGSFNAADPALVFSVNQLDINKADSTYKLKFKSNLPWRAKSNDAWITINDTTDSGLEKDSVVIFSVTKNPTTSPRSGSIVVWITNDYEKVIIINQAAGDPPPVIKRNVYVKAGATGDGSAWNNPISLSAALSLDLAAGDIIHVAAGTYAPENSITGGTAGANGDKTFEFKQNIVLIGGYPANAATGAVSNPSVNTTTLDGSNTANHVVTVSAPLIADQKVLIKGVTIKNGSTAASGSATINGLAFPKNFGGGIIVGKAEAELENCIISNNTAVSGGGGIYCFTDAKLILKQTVVENNITTSAGANGGGIFMDKKSDLFAYNSAISSNGAGGFAGALYQYTGAFHIYNTTIDGNGAGGVGSTVAGKAYGGVYLREGTGELVNCTVYSNTASNLGGGVGVYGTASAPGNLTMVSTTVTGNKVKHGSALGAGLYMNATAVVVNIYNSIVSGNTRGATGTETPSDVEGVTGSAWSKKSTIVTAQVFDNNGASVSGATFDFASMLGPFTNNGGFGKTIKLQGSSNPALTYGMTASQLTSLGSSLPTPVPASIIAFDQIGESRSAKPYIGAVVK